MSNKSIKNNNDKNKYVSLPYFHICPLKNSNIIINPITFNYYDVCDYCRDIVRKYTVPFLYIPKLTKNQKK